MQVHAFGSDVGAHQHAAAAVVAEGGDYGCLIEVSAAHQQTCLDVLGRKAINEVTRRTPERGEHDGLRLAILGQEAFQRSDELGELRVLPVQFAGVEVAQDPTRQPALEAVRRLA